MEATVAGEDLAASRRQAVVAGLAVVAGAAPIAVDGAAEAAADAYEIPVNQQCIECVGSGVISCTQPTTSQCPTDSYRVPISLRSC